MIYLDNAATTRPCPAALDAMRTALEDAWGNPSALYRPGQQARKLVEDARRTVARVLHAARPAEITFTSGVNGASEEFTPDKSIDRCPLCGIALNENGVCPKCGYKKG